MVLKLSEAIEILRIEAEWSLTHPITGFSQDYTDGFINGLQQAMYLLKIAETTIEEDEEIEHFGTSIPCINNT